MSTTTDWRTAPGHFDGDGCVFPTPGHLVPDVPPSTPENPAHYGQHVWQDEEGDYYLIGHVPARRAIAAANRYARVECGLVNLFDDSTSEGLPGVLHRWYRPNPEDPDDDYWPLCEADDPGAQPFTEVYP